MMKYVVCGTSVEDVEAGVQAMKMAIASGATCGVGGSSMAEVEKNLGAMKQMASGVTAPTPKACLHPSCDCPCSYCDCEDEDEEIEVEASGYVARVGGDGVVTPLRICAEEAMAEALDDGYCLCDIEIWEADIYEDGEIVLNEQVFPD